MSESGFNNKTAIIKDQLGFQNPVFNEDTVVNLENGNVIDGRENDTVMESIQRETTNPADFVDTTTSSKKKYKYLRRQSSILADEIDLQICNRIFTIKKRTYVNFKKSIQMIKPFLVLLVMLAVLIVLFRVKLFAATSASENGED